MSRPTYPSAGIALLAFTMAALLPALARADWQGDIEGGTEIRDGDASTRLRGTLAERTRPFTQSLSAEWIRSSGGGDAWRLGYVPRYWFATRLYAFGEARFATDEPLGIDTQLRAALGLGTELIATPDAGFALEAGVGSVSTRFDADIDDDRSAYVLLRGQGYRRFAERLRFDVQADVERSERVTDLRAEVGIALSLATGSVRYAIQTRRVDIDDGPSRDVTEGYLSFGYRF